MPIIVDGDFMIRFRKFITNIDNKTKESHSLLKYTKNGFPVSTPLILE